jgi:hypothetical protein
MAQPSDDARHEHEEDEGSERGARSRSASGGTTVAHGHSFHITDLPPGDAQYVLPLRKQLKPRTRQPVVGGGRFEARLQLSRRSAFARNERMTRLPVVQLVLNVEIDRALIGLPLILSLIVPLQDAAAATGVAALPASAAHSASATRADSARWRMLGVCSARGPQKHAIAVV